MTGDTTAAASLGPARKLAVILVSSQALARQPGAKALFRFML